MPFFRYVSLPFLSPLLLYVVSCDLHSLFEPAGTVNSVIIIGL
ncbi:hypothetical protein HanXRQr2_Chr17g0828041 [Helianthus annuus]|uniref:Uncharacterized protein n=1 Tax=Helianthus annuus TaxID=4232 RepID=A0A9K3DNW0_HELAN|nr:hypothetical protein HanXRQr2_Chr17g0828041 [Helianthus annuus]